MAREGGSSAERREWRRNLSAVWVAQLLSIIGFSFTGPFLPLYLRDLGLTTTNEIVWWSGAMNAGGAVVMALTAPVWGVIADRYGRKPMVLRSMFGGAVAIGLMAFVPNVYALLGLRLLQGALAGTVTASTALVASTTPKDRLGFSLGLMQTAVFSGSSLGPFVGGVTADVIGYRRSFGLTGGLLALAGVLVVVFVRERFDRATAERAAREPFLRGLFAPLADRRLGALIVILFLIGAATMAALPLIPIFVEQLEGGRGNVASLSGAALGAGGLANAIAAIVFGRFADRVGHRRILIGCALGAALLVVPQALVRESWQLILARGLFGIANGGLIPTANALIATTTPPERRGAVYGPTSSASSLGFGLGPLGGAALATAVGIRVVFFATAGIMLFIAGWVVRTLTPSGGAPVARQQGAPEPRPAGVK